MTFGDALDRAFGGVEVFVCDNCTRGLHSVCLGFAAGRTCQCDVDVPHPLARREDVHPFDSACQALAAAPLPIPSEQEWEGRYGR